MTESVAAGGGGVKEGARGGDEFIVECNVYDFFLILCGNDGKGFVGMCKGRDCDVVSDDKIGFWIETRSKPRWNTIENECDLHADMKRASTTPSSLLLTIKRPRSKEENDESHPKHHIP